MLDPLPMIRALFTESNNDDDVLLDHYSNANLSMKQKYILLAMFDLKQSNAPSHVLQPWVDELVDTLMHQDTSAITEFHFAIFKEYDIPLEDYIYTHLELLDDEFEAALEKLDKYDRTDTIHLYDVYTYQLSLLCNPSTIHFLKDIDDIAPSIYEHICEYREYIDADWLEYIPS
jgi:hypothetical protein